MKIKLLPPVENSVVGYIGASDSSAVLANDERNAQNRAFEANKLAAENWTNWFNDSWLPAYYAGTGIRFDAIPSNPPVSQWVKVVEDSGENGSLSFDYSLVDSPSKSLVCSIPKFNRMPAPQMGSVSMMQTLVDEGKKQSNVITLPKGISVGDTATANDGSKWVKVEE